MAVHLELTEEQWGGLVSWLRAGDEYAELLSRAALPKAPTTRGTDAEEKLPDQIFNMLKSMGGSVPYDLLTATVKAALPLERTPGGRDLRRQNITTAIHRSLVPQGRVLIDADSVVLVSDNAAP